MHCTVCSFNLRCDVPTDGINSFAGRKELIRREFPKYKPDLIGFQEAQPHMCEWLEEAFPEMVFLGVGRETNYGGEHTLIGMRRGVFAPVELSTFWLSNTPSVPGSRFGSDQSPCPRTCTAAVLLHRPTGRLVRFYNTHLDHQGKLAQLQGMTLILARMSEDARRYPGTAAVLTGDLNVTPESDVIKEALSFPLVDATAPLGDTFHAYHPEKPGLKIDYILTDAPIVPESARTLTDEADGVFFSDHFPITAEIELGE